MMSMYGVVWLSVDESVTHEVTGCRVCLDIGAKVTSGAVLKQ